MLCAVNAVIFQIIRLRKVVLGTNNHHRREHRVVVSSRHIYHSGVFPETITIRPGNVNVGGLVGVAVADLSVAAIFISNASTLSDRKNA